jgi:hypothetical protein
MAEILSQIKPDPRLLSGPIELTNVVFGEDELNERFRHNEELLAEDLLSPSQSRVTLQELVDFNAGTSSIVPAIRVPTQVRLIDPRSGLINPTRFVLKRESQPPRVVDVFVLKPLIPVELTSSRINQTSTEAIDHLLTIVEKDSSADLEMFLASMQLNREIALEQLRRLAEIHRDAVQNAVDILQTKRIDFLENPQETGIEGSIMAFVVALIAGGVTTSVVGSVVELIATGVFSIIGRWERKRANETISAFIRQRQDQLEVATLSLKSVQRKFVPGNARGSRMQNTFKEQIAKLKKDVSQAKMEQRLLLQGLLEDSMVRSQALRARLKDPIKKADGGPDLVNKAGEFVTGKATESLSAIPSSVTQTKADSSVQMTAMPLDVAIKMEVQNYFDPWLLAAEDSIRFLKQARLTVISVPGLLSDEAIDEIIALVELSAALDEFSASVSSLTAGAFDLRADLTSFYELLLWLTMYKSVLSERPVNPADIGKLRVDSKTGQLLPPRKHRPKYNQAINNLLRYLALRFFGMGKIEGEGKDSKLVFSDAELDDVYVKIEELSAKLFTPQSALTDKGNSGLEVALLQSLKSIRFVVMPYEARSSN